MAKNKRYDNIQRALEKMIESMGENTKLPPIRTLMKELGVSQSPLDNALRNLEEMNWITRVQGSGIYVAQRKKRQKIGTIGIVINGIADHFCRFVLKGVEQTLADAGYRMLLCNSHVDLEDEIKTLKSLKGKIDGLILFPYTAHALNPEYITYFNRFSERFNIPLVTLYMPIHGIQSNLVLLNEFHCMHEAMDRVLVDKYAGARIVFLGNMASQACLTRLMGVRSKLSACAWPTKPLVLDGDANYSDFSATLSACLQAHPDGQWVFINAYPPALPALLSTLADNNIAVPEQALIMSVVEEDYRDYINDDIIALVKPDVALGRGAAAMMLSALDDTQEKNSSSMLDMALEIPAVIEAML